MVEMRKVILVLCLVLLIPVNAMAKPGDPSEPVEYEGFTAPEYTTEDIMILAEVMYHENYCNGDYIMLLTGSVVLNRVKSKHFPNTIYGVIYQRGQYATPKYFGTVRLPRKLYHMAEMLLERGSIAPPEVVFQSMFKQGSGIYYTERGEYFCYE